MRGLIVIVALAAATTARAQEPAEEVQLNLARMCVNESNWRNRDDCEAIWQVTTTLAREGADAETLLRWQQALSPRVTGAAEPRDVGNERWSRNLTWSNTKPEGWPDDVPWDRYQPAWEAIRDWAARKVGAFLDAGERRHTQCRGRVVAWVGTRTLREDRDFMRRRNAARAERGLPPLVPLDCGDTVNVFFGRPRGGRRAK